jgi:hypothetical protein
MNATLGVIGNGQLSTSIGEPDGFADVTDIAGTEETHEFELVAYLPGVGRLAVREYATNRWRIRLEPTTNVERRSKVIPALAKILKAPDWKQPGDASQDRFSTTAATTERDAALSLALNAMVRLSDGAPVIEETAPPWMRSVIDECWLTTLTKTESPQLPEEAMTGDFGEPVQSSSTEEQAVGDTNSDAHTRRAGALVQLARLLGLSKGPQA